MYTWEVWVILSLNFTLCPATFEAMVKCFTSSSYFLSTFDVNHVSLTHCTDLIVLSWSTFNKLQAVLWAWCTNQSNPVKPVNVHLFSFSRWLLFNLLSLCVLKLWLSCLCKAMLQRRDFLTKGKTVSVAACVQHNHWTEKSQKEKKKVLLR